MLFVYLFIQINFKQACKYIYKVLYFFLQKYDFYINLKSMCTLENDIKRVAKQQIIIYLDIYV